MFPLISNTAVTSFADVVPNVHDIIFPYALLRRVEPRMCGGAAASPNGAIRTPARWRHRIPVPIIPITKDAKSQV